MRGGDPGEDGEVGDEYPLTGWWWGPAGNAVALNGNTVTWRSGAGDPNVKGPIT
jgi:hypothetical protein